MGTFAKIFSSSLGKKIIMSLTGLFLCIFLIVHLIGNLQLFKNDGGQAFNAYAYTMTHFIPIKVISYLLYISIIVHAVYALILTSINKKARPIGYAMYNGKANSPWTSRNMGILGTIILIFLVVHMNNFWAQYHWGNLPYARYEISLTDPHDVKVTPIPFIGEKIENAEYTDADKQVNVVIARDLYQIVGESFKQWWYVAFYVFAMGALAFHLVHGFRSAFQTLGWDHRKYVPLIRFIGEWGFGFLIPVLFAAMPLYFFFFK